MRGLRVQGLGVSIRTCKRLDPALLVTEMAGCRFQYIIIIVIIITIIINKDMYDVRSRIRMKAVVLATTGTLSREGLLLML